MKKIVFTLPFIAIFNFIIAQIDNTNNLKNKNPLAAIPSSFKFFKELRKICFVHGRTFNINIKYGGDSISLNTMERVTVPPLLISMYETTNADYKDFVHYVRDSVAHTLLNHFILNNNRLTLNWDEIIDWTNEKLEPMMLGLPDRLYGRREIDVYKLAYKMSNGEEIFIYPDTLVWLRDVNFLDNSHMAVHYFANSKYANYPVVGVSQLQALAYCDWKTNMWNAALDDINFSKFRLQIKLPSNEEWQLAALEKKATDYLTTANVEKFEIFELPLEQEKTTRNLNENPKIKYKCNFGPIIDKNLFWVKSYENDGYLYTAPCNSFKPNSNGLFNMSGNVAEWTRSNGSYKHYTIYKDSTDYILTSNLKNFPNSDITGMTSEEVNKYLEKFAIVKGGSWISIPYYLQPGVNQYFKAENKYSYIGFRIVVTTVENYSYK